MSPIRTPRPTAFLPSALLFAVLGWGGVLLLLNSTLPTLGPRWLFFFLIVIALTGTAMPAAAHLNQRFPSSPPAGADVILRQALWFGIYGATLAWLNYGHVFTLNLAGIILLGFTVIEIMLRLRERSQWKP
ncbi:MAG: hypothetical protein OEZ02_01900 [Anaerolineae bacterium]|nr:hypothetical protein [Anaerolineae bacterium]